MVANETNRSKLGANIVLGDSTLSKESVESLYEVFQNKQITILGHDNIDVDSVISGILLSKLLDFLGIKNKFYILEEVKENDTYVIMKELLNIDIKEYQKIGEVANRNLFLVDHYETVHEGEVVAVIDHHPNYKNKKYMYKYVKNSSAAAYMIYELMKQVKYSFTKEEIKMLIVAMLIDTVAFKSSKTEKAEVDLAKKLATEYEIDFEFLEKYSMRITEIDKMTEEEIISNGEKWYSFKRSNDVFSSYLQLYGMPAYEIRERWLELVKEKLIKTDSELGIFIIYDMQNNETYEYQVKKSKTSMMIYSGILSRGKDIMPKVERKYMAN